MDIFDRLLNLDRKIIYLILGISGIVPFFLKLNLPVRVTPEVQAIYDYIENISSGEIIHLSIDYDPSTDAENNPQAESIMRHCFSRNIKLIITALSQNGAGMAEILIGRIASEYGKQNGTDYAYLGYKPYPGFVIMGMGQNYRINFPEDYYGTPVDTLPLMNSVKNYDNVACIISISAGNIADMWLTYGHERYKVDLALAVTAVIGPQYYAFLQSRQIFGLIPGLKGAAEYEKLLEPEYKKKGFNPKALLGMDVQSITHLVIVLFIFVGNICYIGKKYKSKKII